jgi:hypothetical protein
MQEGGARSSALGAGSDKQKQPHHEHDSEFKRKAGRYDFHHCWATDSAEERRYPWWFGVLTDPKAVSGRSPDLIAH